MTDGSIRSWSAWVAGETGIIRAAGQWREPRSFDSAGPRGTLVATGRQVTSFASNDYLGLSQHPSVTAAAVEAIQRWGSGSGASRLVVGSRPVHHDLESAIALWRNTEAAIAFPTGYAANLGLLSTLGGRGVEIFSDELNHASIVDGCRLARANGAAVTIYPHLDLVSLRAAMASSSAMRLIVVTDSVFSMDGDVAPVDELVALCAEFDALLVLDEAHSVLQDVPSGSGRPDLIVQVGTMSKTLGALGGFVAASRPMVELLVNRARPYIFTTASSPADAAAALAAIGILGSPDGDRLIRTLRSHVDRIAPGHVTPIIPWVLGDEAAALDAAAALLERGLLVPAIRPPTVPAGGSRLRIALSASHTDAEIKLLVSTLVDLGFVPGDVQ
jgi:8-amino-7-oxononanoate synthase